MSVKSLRLWLNVPDDVVSRIVNRGTVREVHPGQPVLDPVTVRQADGIIIAGTVFVEETDAGRPGAHRFKQRPSVATVLKRGAIVGRFGNVVYVAATPCRVLVLGDGDLDREMAGNAALAVNVAAVLAWNLRIVTARALEAQSLTALERVVATLRRFPVVGKLAKIDLGRVAGVSRETATRILADLTDSGDVVRTGRFVELVDRDR